MLYHTFLTAVRQQMEKRLGDSYVLTILQLPKNNGVCLDGLSIRQKGSMTAPTVCLNDFYKRFQDGMALSKILDEITSLCERGLKANPLDPVTLCDPDFVRPRIAYRLVNAASNAELLKKLPHIPVLDLAKVFYLHAGQDESGLLNMLVTHDHLKLWGMDLNTLNELAVKNTPLLFPPHICSVDNAVLGLLLNIPFGTSAPPDPAHKSPTPLYILSNRFGVTGAACMLYPDTLKDFAELFETDLIVLPSSIHEVLLLPDSGDRLYEELGLIVASINRTEVEAEERLSNQVYLYSRSMGRLRMAPICADPL